MKKLATALGCLVAFAWGTAASAHKSSPDDGYYSFYEVSGGGSLELVICNKGGCYPGFFDTFEQPCAVIETVPKVKGTTMDRDIFIMDKRNSESDPVTLSIYHRTDTSTGGGGDDFNVTFTKKIVLDITAGPAANCDMVMAPKYLYFGTNLSAVAERADLKKFKTERLDGPITQLTADSRGYVTLLTASGFDLFDPDGTPVLQGGGSPYEAGNQVSTPMSVPPIAPSMRAAPPGSLVPSR
jgi:hypothetical protein